MLFKSQFLNDSIVGGTIGISQSIVGHPFDTIKVIYQNKTSMNNVCIKTPIGLYRGIKYPIIASFLSNLSLFPLYEQIKNKMKVENNIIYNKNNNSYWPSFIGGTIGGILSTPIMFITDLAKIKKQMNGNIKINYINLIKKKGGPITLCREGIACGFYFYTYDKLNYQYNWDSFLAGRIAGCVTWTVTYPIDVLKTQQMTLNNSLRQCVRLNTKISDYWRGYIPCILRSFIVNGVSFYIYDKMKHRWNL